MDSDIVTLYLTKKKENICNYAEIFLKYSIKSETSLNKILSKIVEIYIDNYYLENNTNYELLTKYFEISKTEETLMKNVLSSALIFYNNSGLEAQIKNDIKTIVLLSNAIFLSINLENYTNEYRNSAIDIDIRFNNFFDEFKDKLKLEDDELKKLEDVLLNKIKKDVSSEKKFWKLLNDDNYILDFKDSSSQKNYFIVDYHYDIKTLNRYDKQDIDRIVKTKSIYDDNLSIFIDKLSIVVLKDLLCNNLDDRFLISIHCDYFNKNKNTDILDSILGNKSVRERIIFTFDINEIEDNSFVIKYLNDNNFKCAIKGLDDYTITDNKINLFDYIIISSELENKYKDYKEIWNIKGINTILDINSFNNTNEDYILRENR